MNGGEHDNLPSLVFDSLDGETPPRAEFVRQVIRAVLERKYGHLCPPAYVEMVVASVTDDPVRLRDFKYVKKVAISS